MESSIESSAHSGNTNLVRLQKSRNFILTLNQIERWETLKSYLCERNHTYILCCEHDGPSQPHYHVYIQFPNLTTLDISKLEGSHVEVSKGSAQQNIRYCKALDDKHIVLGVHSKVIFEEGKPKLRGGCHITYAQAKTMTQDQIDELGLRDASMVKKIQSEPKPIKVAEWRKDIKVYYIQGPSGSGKSFTAQDLVVQHGYDSFDEVCYQEPFWMGISGQSEACIFDDWRPSTMKASEFIKFIDYNRHTVPIKGGFTINNYKLIIFTSVIPIEQIYASMMGEPRNQWLRRLHVIRLQEWGGTPHSSFDSNKVSSQENTNIDDSLTISTLTDETDSIPDPDISSYCSSASALI